MIFITLRLDGLDSNNGEHGSRGIETPIFSLLTISDRPSLTTRGNTISLKGVCFAPYAILLGKTISFKR